MLATIRDIAIILLALLDMILIVLLIVIAYVLLRLVQMLRSEAMPVLGAVKKTTTTVEGTADFLSTTAVRPLIRLVALTFAVTRFFQVLLGRSSAEGEAP